MGIVVLIIFGFVGCGMGLWAIWKVAKNIQRMNTENSAAFSDNPAINRAFSEMSSDHATLKREMSEIRYIMQSLLNSVEEVNRQANPYRR